MVAFVGRIVGRRLGTDVLGALEGAREGARDGVVVGALDGALDGARDGADVGERDGLLVGERVGGVGALDGALDGALEGARDGALDGDLDGDLDGAIEGDLDGDAVVGFIVGEAVLAQTRKLFASGRQKPVWHTDGSGVQSHPKPRFAVPVVGHVHLLPRRPGNAPQKPERHCALVEHVAARHRSAHDPPQSTSSSPNVWHPSEHVPGVDVGGHAGCARAVLAASSVATTTTAASSATTKRAIPRHASPQSHVLRAAAVLPTRITPPPLAVRALAPAGFRSACGGLSPRPCASPQQQQQQRRRLGEPRLI